MPKPTNVRSRRTEGPSGSSQQWFKFVFSGDPAKTPYPAPSVNDVRRFSGTQKTVSEGHHWPPPKGNSDDRGGPFYTTRSYIDFPDGAPKHSMERRISEFQWEKVSTPLLAVACHDGRVNDTYVGPTQPLWPPTMESTLGQLNARGAEAIAKCKPTNSVADASTFLGELLKDGLPSAIGHTLWKDRTKQAITYRQKVAGEHLNYQFGIKPIVNEVSKFADAVRRADTVLAQYERDAGKLVRRRYNFPLQKGTEQTVTPNATPKGMPGLNLGTFYMSPYGSMVRTREWSRRQWFAGAFTYHLPTGYDSRSEMARKALLADKLFGISLTPEVLWNLAPWSWAADWFTNAGDVLSNISDMVADGLVMRYGYMMEHTIVKDTYTWVGPNSMMNRSLPVSPVVLVTETKQRVPANPFGFGVTWDGLSPLQISILAALGITRGRR